MVNPSHYDHKNNGNSDTIKFSTISWGSNDYKAFVPQIKDYLSELKKVPLIISVQDLQDFYQDISFLDKPEDFSKLTSRQKCFICMSFVSTKYAEYLLRIEEYKAALDEMVTRISKNNVGSTSSNTKNSAVGDKIKNDAGYTLEKSDEFEITNPLDYLNSIDINPFDFDNDDSALISLPTVPGTKEVFDHLVRIKRSFLFILEQFYRILKPFDSCHIDIKTYNALRDAVTSKDYSQFSEIVNNWDGDLIDELSTTVELIFPLCLYLESQATNNIFEATLYDLTRNAYPLPVFKSRYTSTLLIILIHYIRYRHLAWHLKQDELAYFNVFWRIHGIKFSSGFEQWINAESKTIFEYFHKNYVIADIQDDANDNLEKQKIHPDLKNDGEPEPPKVLEPEIDAPEYIEVPCGQRMLEMLAHALTYGHNDETLGRLNPLVKSQKREESLEIVKRKLICLFSGVGIHDESIKWPYKLEWTDSANSLKLLIYLLHYEGILDPFDAINEEDVEGISDEIRTNFKGRPVWNIVGKALGYGKDTLRNKVKIPKRSNMYLMKQIAQLWYDCKKLDV